jgi:methionine-rich copper-binding protein CopC
VDEHRRIRRPPSLPNVFVVVCSRIVLVVVVLGVVTVVAAGSSAGHADLVAATPAPCEVMNEVTAVEVRFDEPLVATSSEVTLIDAAGAVVATGGSVTDTLFQGTMSIPLTEPLAPGNYQVTWTSSSARDGDSDQGRFGFTVGSAGAVAAPDCSLVTGDVAQVEGPDAASEGEGGVPLVVVLLGGLVVVVAVGAFILGRRHGARTG